MGGRVGVDLVPYGRVRAMVHANSRALGYMLTAAETTLSTTVDGLDVAAIAGRLAAKEAVFKLLRADGETVPWSTTEILRGAGGWPEVRLSGRAAALAGAHDIGEISVSITHDDNYAIAVAFTVTSSTNGTSLQQMGGCQHECCNGKPGSGTGLDSAQASRAGIPGT